MGNEQTGAEERLRSYCQRMRASEDGVNDTAWPHAAAIETVLDELTRLRSRITEMEGVVVDYLRRSGGRFNMQEDDIEAMIADMAAARVLKGEK